MCLAIHVSSAIYTCKGVVTRSYSICAVISFPRLGIGNGKMSSKMVYCFKKCVIEMILSLYARFCTYHKDLSLCFLLCMLCFSLGIQKISPACIMLNNDVFTAGQTSCYVSALCRHQMHIRAYIQMNTNMP